MNKTLTRPARREAAINEVVRLSRATGATTTVERAGEDEHWLGVEEDWAVTCLSHSTFIGVDSRADAWIVAASPQNFCGPCSSIDAGAAPRVATGKVSV